ncbi:MAG TPA: DUF5995 family protein [Gaiellaceae bacterium]|nr:DUF5995 family protein [Gaiellaceae bacterium]
MSVRICAVLAASLALAGCGGDREEAVEDSPWTAIAATLSGPLDPRSPNVCNRGDVRCIDAVVAEMTRRFEPLAADCDHRAPFALMYLRVTEAVGREERGGSLQADRPYLAHLDAIFGQLYFEASDAWAEGRRVAVPAAWLIAFEAAKRRRVSGVGNLLLGMNAHISRDLPFAVESIGLGRTAARRDAFREINEVLGDVHEAILAESSTRFDPTIAGFRLPVVEIDAATVGVVLGRWRETALADGRSLLSARTTEQRADVVRTIEDNAAQRAAVIVAATARVPFSEAGKARDRYCDARA